MSSVGNIWVNLQAKDQATKTIKSAFSSMTSMAAKFAVGFGAFSFLKTGINAASDYAEAQDSLNRLIGNEGVSALEKFGQTSAKTAGLSRSEALEMANNFAGLFQQIPDGAIETGSALANLEQRVSDLGSQFNRSNEEIATGLQSALAGRVSLTLQQMGIYLDATTMKTKLMNGEFANIGYSAQTSWDALDNGTQVLLRYQSFLNQSNASAGNFADTLGISYPNQVKNFKASMTEASQNIGQKLMPSIMKIMPVLEKLAKFIGDNTDLILGLGAAFVGFKLGSFIGKIGMAIAQLMGMAAAKTAAQTGLGAVAAVPMVLGAVGAAIAGIGAYAGITGGGSSGSSYSSGASSNSYTPNPIHISVNSITGEAGINGQAFNSQGNVGRGGT